MERRAFPRLKSRINARLLLNNETDGDGLLLDFSASGAAIETALSAAPGDRLVLHLDGGSRFEGVVARVFEGGFAVEFGMHENKRERLVNALEARLAEEDELTALPLKQRVSQRIGGFRSKTRCRIENGGEIECRLVDMSLGGAAIETDADIKIGSRILLGQTPGKIVRRDGMLYGVQFDPSSKTAPVSRQEEPVSELSAPSARTRLQR